MKVRIENCEPLLVNPEDKFNELIKGGYSVNEALLSIMEDAILEKKIEEDYPDYRLDWAKSPSPGEWDVKLVEDEW